MAVGASLQLPPYESDALRIYSGRSNRFESCEAKSWRHLHFSRVSSLSSSSLRWDVWSLHVTGRIYRPLNCLPHRHKHFVCRCFSIPSFSDGTPLLKNTSLALSRTLYLVVLPSAASQVVKQRLLNFVQSLSTVLAFAYCLTSLIQQTQKFFMEKNSSNDSRNMGFQFAGKAVYTAVWVAAFSLSMELLGFSTHKWVTAGGLGKVLLTLAGREIFTNFLSSIMIHATRPFVPNERIQAKIEGYDVSGTVEHVGWWSPTIIRGEDREAVHILIISSQLML